MPETLNYAPPAREGRRLLAAAANITLAFPLLVAGAVYGQWTLAWLSLGPPQWRRVRPGWLDDLAVLAVVAAFPAFMAAFALNVEHVRVNDPPRLRAAIRILGLIVSWGALFALFGVDP
jgi:hypothetical protein